MRRTIWVADVPRSSLADGAARVRTVSESRIVLPKFMRLRTIVALVALVGMGPRLSAQRPDSTRDSTRLEQQARQLARLDSQITALQREMRAQRGDSGGTFVAPAPAAAIHLPIRVSGLLQVWYAQGDGGFQSTFRVRRATIKFSGDVSPRARWTVGLEAARLLTTSNATTNVAGTTVVTQTTVNQNSRPLQDAFIALALPGRLQLDVGQFKVPLGVEGSTQSSAVLETVERALFSSDRSRGGTYSNSRDLGLLVRTAPMGRLDVAVGVFNGVGESQNDTDRNRQKAVVSRIGGRLPFFPQLEIGASGATTVFGGPDSLLRHRAGTDLKLVAARVVVKGEFMMGRDGARRGEGWFGHVGFSPTPRLTLVARHDVFDPDRGRESALANARERDWIGGFTYDVPVMHVRLQMNYVRKNFQPALASASGLLLTNLQASW